MRRRSVPTRVGSYYDVEFAYEGGMAVVYHAHGRGSAGGRKYALKFPIDDRPGPLGSTQRLLQEGELGQRLRHANLVGIESIQYHDGVPYLVMPWVDGYSLHALLDAARAGGSPLDTTGDLVTYLASQVLDTLHYVHGLDIVHRDITPENILIELEGGVRVIDFGIAALAEGQPLKTRIGKLGYIAPEQQAGRADHRSDLYSLGVVLAAVAGADVDATPVRAPSTLPAALQRFVDRLLEHDPNRRFRSALDAKEELNASIPDPGAFARGHRLVRARIAGLAPRQIGAETLAADVARAKRRTAWAIAAHLMVLAGLSMATPFVASNGGEPIANDNNPNADAGSIARAAGTPPCEDSASCEAACNPNGGTGNAEACVRLAEILRFDSESPGLAAAKRGYVADCTRLMDPVQCTRAALFASILNDPDLRNAWVDPELRPDEILAQSCEVGRASSVVPCSVLVTNALSNRVSLAMRERVCAAIPGGRASRTDMECALTVLRMVCKGKLTAASSRPDPEACYLVAKRAKRWGEDAPEEIDALHEMCTSSDGPSCYYLSVLNGGDNAGRACSLNGVARACLWLAQRTSEANAKAVNQEAACSGGGDCDGVKDAQIVMKQCTAGRVAACGQQLQLEVGTRSRISAARFAEILAYAKQASPQAVSRYQKARDELRGPERIKQKTEPHLAACFLGVAAACGAARKALGIHDLDMVHKLAHIESTYTTYGKLPQ